MKNDQLYAMGYVDERLIEKAETYTGVRRKRPRMKWVVLAACIPLIFGVAAFASETVRYNAAVGYLTSLGIPVEDLSDYSRKEIKEAAKIIAAKETLAVGDSNALVDEYYKTTATNKDLMNTPAKVTSDQIRELKPTMTRSEVLALLGDTLDVGSGFYIYVYEVDEDYLLRIPFAGDDGQLGVKGTDLLKALEPIEK